MAEPGRTAPFWATFDVTGLSPDTLIITSEHKNSWVFASEFEFNDVDASAIPEPSSILFAPAAL